jgi:hypothetical protein
VVADEYEPDLSCLLAPPGQTGLIGPERGQIPIGTAIAVYRARVPGVLRYVAYVNGAPLAGLQIVKLPHQRGRWVVANVYTSPEARRQYWATALFHQAERDVGRLQHSDHRSAAAQRWIASLSPAHRPGPRGAADALPPGFEGFAEHDYHESDLHPEPDDVAVQRRIEAIQRENAALYDARRFLRPTFYGLVERIYLFPRGRTWFIYDVQSTTPGQAKNFGRRVQRALIGRRNLAADTPALHHLPLYVGYGRTFIELPPLK